MWMSHALSFDCLQVLKVDDSDSSTPYFVHYVGWNSRWDEWIGRDAVVEFADATAACRKSKCPAKVEVLIDFVVCQFYINICQYNISRMQLTSIRVICLLMLCCLLAR